MTQISILGCGWLGLPLAKTLLERGFGIKGSTTSAGRLPLLQESGIQPYLIAVGESGIEGDFGAFAADSEILIIDIPPKLRGLEKESFIAKINTLAAIIEKTALRKILFISSTAIYSDTHNTIRITENSPANPQTEPGRQLLQSELLLKGNMNFETTVLRFSGLIGEDRHPVYFLAGRKGIDNPEAPINLIHLRDCIGIIVRIIEKGAWNEAFNAAAPFHPTREAYYARKAIELDLELPEFDYRKKSVGKIISSDKIATALNYSFVFNPL